MIRLLIACLALSALVVAGMLVLERLRTVTITIDLQRIEKPGVAAPAVSPFAVHRKG